MRKNAVLALTAIYRLPKGELLVPDAPDLVERMLQNEQVGGWAGCGKRVAWWVDGAGQGRVADDAQAGPRQAIQRGLCPGSVRMLGIHWQSWTRAPVAG